jgi:hypothetical protein
MGSGDMELDGGGIPMEGMSGLEDYAGMAGEDKDFGGMFEAAAGMEGMTEGGVSAGGIECTLGVSLCLIL